MGNFKEYLISKKIDPAKFDAGDRPLYLEFAKHFNQMHPDSFTSQKLFLINKVRRKYILTNDSKVKPPTKSVKARPKIKPRTT